MINVIKSLFGVIGALLLLIISILEHLSPFITIGFLIYFSGSLGEWKHTYPIIWWICIFLTLSVTIEIGIDYYYYNIKKFEEKDIDKIAELLSNKELLALFSSKEEIKINKRYHRKRLKEALKARQK